MFAVSSFFRRFSFHILGSWFVSPFRRVFSPFRWVFSPFQNRQTHAKWQTYKNCSEAEKHAASNNSWQGNNFAYIGRRRYIYAACIYIYIYILRSNHVYKIFMCVLCPWLCIYIVPLCFCGCGVSSSRANGSWVVASTLFATSGASKQSPSGHSFESPRASCQLQVYVSGL